MINGVRDKVKDVIGNPRKYYWRASIIVILFVLPIGYQFAYAGRVFPGVSLGQVDVGGLSFEQMNELVKSKWADLGQRGFTLQAPDGRQVTLPTIVTGSSDPDLTYSLISLDIEKTLSSAQSIGRQGNIFIKWWQPLWLLISNKSLSLSYTFNEDNVLKFISENFVNLEKQPRLADLKVDSIGNVSVSKEQDGYLLDKQQFFNDLGFGLDKIEGSVIKLHVTSVSPELNEKLALSLIPEVKKFINNKNIELVYEGDKWMAYPSNWYRWLGIKKMASGYKVGLLEEKSNSFFADIKDKINQEALNAKMEIVDGRVQQFQASQQGRQMAMEKTLEATEVWLQNNSVDPIMIEVDTVDPSVTTEEVNDLGIKEIIGVGHSNFAGSPKNRRHNIKVGADTLNGVLIKPGDEFSLIKTLGDIDGEHGYLQELVIKGNKTIPEYGGGLCQIGTTTFRAALATGLPILERRNHSYRVVYYEPAGTDATIYDPSPDFKFKNDTANAILIQTKIDGDDLIFEFWGTSDQRKVEQTKPEIYNIVVPAPTKFIETEDLAPGEKKCTERAHNGADAKFTYTVTYDTGVKKQEEFKSHYVPWQEVCLIGVPKGTLQTQVVPTDLHTPDAQGAIGN